MHLETHLRELRDLWLREVRVGTQFLQPGVVGRTGPIVRGREHRPHPLEVLGIADLPRPSLERFKTGYEQAWITADGLNKPGAAGISVENEKKGSHGAMVGRHVNSLITRKQRPGR